MNSKTTKPEIPVLGESPFAPSELVDHDTLSVADCDFLGRQEQIIEAGQRTFIEVGTALLAIREYENGKLYKRYGTFAAYCLERWEFGRSYAHRLENAVGVYRNLLPRGNKSEGIVLPTTERQIRALSRLPSVVLQRQAWRATIDAAGNNSIRTRDVDREVRAIMKDNGIEPPASKHKRHRAQPLYYRIGADDASKIKKSLVKLRTQIAKLGQLQNLESLLDEIEGLLWRSEDDLSSI